MTVIGVITRGKYGHRLIESIKEHSDFSVVTTDLPEFVPAFIEDPDEFLENLDFDRHVFSADIVVSYALHPDLTSSIAKLAAEAGVRSLIVPGGPSRHRFLNLKIFLKLPEWILKWTRFAAPSNPIPATGLLLRFLGLPS